MEEELVSKVVEIILLKIVGLVRPWHLATVELGPDDARVWKLQDTPISYPTALAHRVA